MKNARSVRTSSRMRAEYDFSGGVRGKYVEQYRKGTNLVVLEPEVARAFPDSESVNEALRALLSVASRVRGRKGIRS